MVQLVAGWHSSRGDVRIWHPENAELGAIAAYESVFAYRFKLYIERHGYSGTGNMAVFRRDFDRVGPLPALRSPKTWSGESVRCARDFDFDTPRDDRLPSGPELSPGALRQMG